MIVVCPSCHQRVVARPDGTCPSCRREIPESAGKHRPAPPPPRKPAPSVFGETAAEPRPPPPEPLPCPERPPPRTIDWAAVAEGVRELEIPRVEPVRTTPGYRLSLALVTGLVLLLPLVYLGLVLGAVGFCFWWPGPFALEHGIREFASLAYTVAPVLLSAVLAIFLVKPVFASRPKGLDPVALRPAEAPGLFALVAALTDSVRAPRPKQVCVDLQANASASFLGGIAGLGGRRLRLVVGLPLVAGLPKRDLAGVLAHEFGHFAQGSGMRATFLLRTINGWLHRLATERDRMDDVLRRLSGVDLRISWLFWLARLMVWLTRRILLGLMIVSNAVSCALLRQMEFDADRHETRLAGSDAFRETSRRVVLLTVANEITNADLDRSWSEGRLPDDLPAFVASGVERLSPDARAEIERKLLEVKTKPFDTHPSQRDRIANAEREGGPGVYRDDGPSDELFADFEGLCRQVTLIHYRGLLDLPVARENLVPSRALADEGAEYQREYEALERFFQGVISAECPLALETDAGEPPADRREALLEIRRDLVARAPDLRSRLEEISSLRQRSISLRILAEGTRADLKVDSKRLGLGRLRGPETIAKEERRVRDRIRRLRAGLEPVARDHGRRMHLCLTILGEGAGDDPPREEVERFRRLQAVLEETRPFAFRLVPLTASFTLVEAQYAAQGAGERFLVRAADFEFAPEAIGLLRQIRERTEQIPYPFTHSREDVDLATHLVERIPEPEELLTLGLAVRTALDRFGDLELRVAGRLAAFAEQAERSLGLDPLPTPRDGESEADETVAG